ncbi:MAG: RDD family protein [Halobacteriovoraceae bacterium]|nr:RDD family protein [Halobacteriovoraceae bacterium]
MSNAKRNFILGKAIKVARTSRLIAKAIDLLIVFTLTLFLYPMGLILSLIYMAVADSLWVGQSVGKKFMGLSVVGLEDGRPCNIRQSAIRNLPFLIPIFFGIIPLWGIVFSLLLGIPIIALELYLLFTLDSGRRLGDVMADTSLTPYGGSAVKIKNQQASWFKP